MIDTKLLTLEDYKITGKLSEADMEKLKEAAAGLRDGKLVAFPTETVYGLGGDALRADVSRRIYEAKGRPSDNPLIVHISSIEELEPLVERVPESCRLLAAAFWPGPMTLVLNKSGDVPKETTGGLDTVAIRMPVHPAAKQLINLAKVPVAAPSANRSGRPSTTTAAHCVEDLEGRVDIIVDGGPCDIGVESTIVDLTGEMPVLLRPGAVTLEMLTQVLGKEPLRDKAVLRSLAEGEKPKAPGMKYRHYAPKAPLIVVRAKKACEQPEDIKEENGRNICGSKENSKNNTDNNRVCERIIELADSFRRDGLHTEILCSQECADLLSRKGRESGCDWLSGVPVRVLGKQSDSEMIAKHLFAQLRATDEDEPDRLIAEGFGENDLFFAIMNRLKKAAGWQIEEV